MSSYFDTFDREVRTLASAADDDTKAFLVMLMSLEERMKIDCLAFAGDRETPDNIAAKIIKVIQDSAVRYAGGAFLGDENGPSDAANMAVVSKTSRLSREMHSLWHEIAQMRLTMRYGLVMDNPERVARQISEYNNNNA